MKRSSRWNFGLVATSERAVLIGLSFLFCFEKESSCCIIILLTVNIFLNMLEGARPLSEFSK
jgi:hypothetical protein